MSKSSKSSSKPRLRSKKSSNLSAGLEKEQVGGMPLSGRDLQVGMSSSLDQIHIAPRTPRATRSSYGDSENGHLGDEVEMGLLGDEERRQAAQGLDDLDDVRAKDAKTVVTSEDKKAMALLIVLYLIQGVPLGLALGSIPFILREHLSYSQLGTFALCGYPYSLKLLWSPIVDSIFIPSVGRRKSWIIPMQLIVGSLMFYMSLNVQKLLDSPESNLAELTIVFTSLVFFSATQDIAVDGWALTLLSEDNISYAATCQTLGLNTGIFASFTVFLALNSVAFSEKWGIPRLTLSAYLQFWSVMCFAVTFWLLFFKKEDREKYAPEDMTIKKTYSTIWEICKLPHVQALIVLHLFSKLGRAPDDAVTSLKLVEKGLGREDLAIVVLIDFPIQIFGGWLAARWSTGDKPLRPWFYAFWPRWVFSVMALFIVYYFPAPPISMSVFVGLVVYTVLSSFTGTIQFVGISAFHTRISDPVIGGTYMTLLNTFSNLGGTWPKYFVLKAVDLFTVATCQVQGDVTIAASECVSDHGKSACTNIGGKCVTETDGYYVVSGICLAFGVIFLIAYIIPTARRLQALPLSKWRVAQT